MMIGGRPAAILAGAAALLAAPALSAQESAERQVAVIGVIVDRHEGKPVPGALVRFHRAADADRALPRVFAEVTTRPDGTFITTALSVGSYALSVRMLGYRNLEQDVRVDGASPMELAIQLVPEAVELEPLVVTSLRSRVLDNAGFYQRRQRGAGRSFTRDEIQQRGASRTTDLLRTVPGVSVRSPARSLSPLVFFRAGCRPDIVVDGHNLGVDVLVDDMVQPWAMEGLEIFVGLTAPPMYSHNPCGAVMIWSLDPSTQEGTPLTWRRVFAAAAFVATALFLTR
jgi:hypothetical protein